MIDPSSFPNEGAVGLPERYSRGAILLHWVTAAMVLSTIPLGLYGANGEGAAAQAATNAHKAVGILILLLTIARLIWRLAHRPPRLPDAVPRAERFVAATVHAALYALLVILPLTGWWMSSAVPERHPIGWPGIVQVPFLPVAQSWASAASAHDLHVRLAWAMIVLAALHIAAALRHHFISRDTVLMRMLGAPER